MRTFILRYEKTAHRRILNVYYDKDGRGQMKKMLLLLILVGVCMVTAGCGETIGGVGKDVNRMGKGISTFFFRQPS